MKSKKRLKYLLRLAIAVIILLGCWRFLHFLIQEVPLGYDPGMYRSYFYTYIGQQSFFDWNSLEPWMQEAFPPYLGFIVATIYKTIGINIDRLLTHGVAFQSALVSIALYFFISAKDKKVALVAALLSWISFVQYEVFWRNYMKQLLGMFFLLMSLGFRVRGRRRFSLPLVIALSATHRPGLMILAVLGVIWVIVESVNRLRHSELVSESNFLGDLKYSYLSIIPIGLIAIIANMFLYPGFITEQISALLSQFIASIDTPVLAHSATAGGTFLTLLDLIDTNSHIMLFALIGIVWSFKEKGRLWYQILAIFGFVRVFAQFSFYQRMIGYMDLFWLIFAGFTLVKLREWRPQLGIGIGVLFFGLHAIIFSYRVERTRRPIMMAEELQFLKTLPDILPPDAVVMNSDASYSTRLKGYSLRPTISPGLFHESKRNKSDRESNWWTNTGKEKCIALAETYGETIEKLYIWQGSKQIPFDFEGADCLEIFRESENKRIPWILYKRNKNLQ